MKKHLQALLILSIFCFTTAEIKAQNNAHNWGIELNGGIMEYQGDLGSALFFARNPDYQGMGLSVGRYLSPWFDAVLNIGIGDVGFYDKTDWLPEPEKFNGFRARIINGQVGLRIKFANDMLISSDALVQPYLMATYGGVNIYSRIVNIDNYYTEPLNSIAAGGGGINFNLSDNFSMRLQTMFNYTFNDNFDGFPWSNGVHKRYANSDAFMYHSVGVVYHFGTGSGGGGKGLKKLKDSDNDGVPNKYDKCKKTPEGALVDSLGCRLDSDKDGVYDEDDKCPNTFGTAENNGCPVISEAVKSQVAVAAKAVYFKTGSADIKEESFAQLDSLVKIMNKFPDAILDIEGHTDNTGDAGDNLTLSQQRADAVKAYLVSKGIVASRMKSVGYGQSRPQTTNDTPEGRAKNRRVYFELHF